jgi:hypothetical protein
MGLSTFLKSMFRSVTIDSSTTRQLDGRSKTLFAASIKMLPRETPGWITLKDAAILFSAAQPEYAFGDSDEQGKADLASFAATAGCRYEFMPVEGRLYFFRNSK